MQVAPTQVNDIIVRNESCTVCVIWKIYIYITFVDTIDTNYTQTHTHTHMHIHTQWDSEHEREREREREKGDVNFDLHKSAKFPWKNKYCLVFMS